MKDNVEKRDTGPAAASGPRGGAFGEEQSTAGRSNQEELMERLEAREGDDRGSGNLGQGVRVGTPAGGLTSEAAERGSERWGSVRAEEEEE